MLDIMLKPILFLVVLLFSFKAFVMFLFYVNFNNKKGLYFKVRDLDSNDSNSKPSNFVYPEEKEKFDWKSIIEPCKNDMEWKYRTVNHKERQNRTRARNCVIIDYQINSAGLYTWFLLQTKTDDGSKKYAGGDYWRASLTGAANQNGVVNDLNNGRYKIWFLITEPGLYTLHLVLEYSLCDGLRDPPAGWFEKGNKHGRFQEEGILGYLDDFLVETFAPISFKVTKTTQEDDLTNHSVALSINGKTRIECFNKSSAFYSQSCYRSSDFNHSCTLIWSGYGNWKQEGGRLIWKPIFPILNPADYSSQDKLETLWFMGDSLTYRLWDSSYTRVLCRKAFKKCKKMYTWVYKIGKQGEAKKPINVGLKFNHTRFFEPLHEIYNSTDMRTNRSVIVVNFGLHIVMSLNFSEYRILLEKFIQIIEHYKKRGESSPQLIWKTTTLSHKENTKRWNVTQARFLSNQRISLFNAYTNSRLCTAGVPILDVFPISASFHEGTKDHVHYKYSVFEPVEDTLADFVWKHYNKY